MSLLAAVALSAWPALVLASQSGPSAVRIEGRVERVDLERRSFTLGTRSGATRETREVLLLDETVISSGGRPLPLEALRPGETVAVSVADPGARSWRVRLVKVGASQHEAPSPGARQQ